jgi:hypothetical protein
MVSPAVDALDEEKKAGGGVLLPVDIFTSWVRVKSPGNRQGPIRIARQIIGSDDIFGLAGGEVDRAEHEVS